MAISTFITGKAPYKNVLVNDLILDKERQEDVANHKGNTVDPFAAVRQIRRRRYQMVSAVHITGMGTDASSTKTDLSEDS